MTMMLDAPTTTRKEKVMLERKIVAATAEPETTTAAELPVVEQVPTDVVIDSTDLEQSVEVVTDTTAEAVTEPSVPADDDDDDALPVSKPRTRGLPLVALKPSRKDMTDDEDAVPYAPPMSSNRFFDDDEDESGVDLSAFRKGPMTDEEMEAFDRELDAKNAAAKALREAEEKAAKEKAAEADAKRLKRRSRRMLGKILMGIGALAMSYGAVVPYVPWL